MKEQRKQRLEIWSAKSVVSGSLPFSSPWQSSSVGGLKAAAIDES